MTQYVQIQDGRIIRGVGRPDPADFDGEPDPAPVQDGLQYFRWQGELTLSGAPSPSAVYEWDGSAPVWVERGDLDTCRTYKVAAMSEACAAAIVAGFKSSALGTEHTYPAKPNDQANLSGSIIDSILPGNLVGWTTPFWCADAAGAWDFRPHTAAQIQQVGRDGKAAILACMTLNESLRAQIMAAGLDELNTIHWPA